jgi:3-methyladenine DNA glycosylase AlkD
VARATEDRPPTLKDVRAAVRALADEERARVSMSFFRRGPGEYGEGDVFLGIRMPDLRTLVKRFAGLPFEDASMLLRSRYHEERMLALLILVRAFRRGDAAARERVHRLYIDGTRWIDSWDLVDLSAEHVVGGYLADHDPPHDLLTRFAGSASLWERRIALLATFHFIKRNEFDEAFRIVALLLDDSHDMIHKAMGWMLREIGKRDQAAEESFLRRHYARLPRTTLRYAIERFPEEVRRAYLRAEM